MHAALNDYVTRGRKNKCTSWSLVIIPPALMERIRNILNHGSILVFISGTDHPYINYPNVIFKHIPYDVSQFYQYDYTHFRPLVKAYLLELDNLLHYSVM